MEWKPQNVKSNALQCNVWTFWTSEDRIITPNFLSVWSASNFSLKAGNINILLCTLSGNLLKTWMETRLK